MSNDSEIKSFSKIVWKTNIKRNVQEFSSLIQDDKIFKEYFGKDYVEKIIDKSKDINNLVIKLILFNTVLILSLFASIHFNQKEFEILGYSFKNLGNYKELLLFISSLISPIIAVSSAYNSYLNALIKECVKREILNSDIRKFYSEKYINNYFSGWNTSKPEKGNFFYGIYYILNLILVISILTLFLVIILVSFSIQAVVIYDVIKNPSSSYYINLFVILFSVISILFTWLVSILQLPVPEKDYSNLEKLKILEKNDPEKYKSIINDISLNSSKKDSRFFIFISTFIFVITFVLINLLFYPERFENMSMLILSGIPVALFVLFFSSVILDFIFQKGRVVFLKKYPNESDERTNAFILINKKFNMIKILVPFLLTILYLYVYS